VAAVEFTRWYLAGYFFAVAIFYSARVLGEKARIGRSPVFSGTIGTAHFAHHLAFRVFRAAILVACCIRLVWPAFDAYLVPIGVLWHPAVILTGDTLMLASVSAALYVHFYLGREWRSGTRLDDEPRLITSGPFARSRNPMMIFVMMGQVGLFLALPTVFTLVCLVVGVWAVTAQVKVEEQMLATRHGAAYEGYASQTPRWLMK